MKQITIVFSIITFLFSGVALSSPAKTCLRPPSHFSQATEDFIKSAYGIRDTPPLASNEGQHVQKNRASRFATPVEMAQSNRITTFTLPEDLFDCGIDIVAVLRSVLKEELADVPLIAITGSYLYALTEQGDPDPEIFKDFDIRVFTKNNLTVDEEEKIYERYFQILKTKKIKVAYSKYGDYPLFIYDKQNTPYGIDLIFCTIDSLFDRKNLTVGSYRIHDMFYGDVTELNTILNKVGFEAVVTITTDFYFSEIDQAKQDMASGYPKHGLQKSLKRLYELAYIRGKGKDFRWLLTAYKKLSRHWNEYEFMSHYNQAIKLLDGDRGIVSFDIAIEANKMLCSNNNGERSMDFVKEVFAEYALGAVQGVTMAVGGRVNKPFIVTTDKGIYVMKQKDRDTPQDETDISLHDQVLARAHLENWLKAKGFPEAISIYTTTDNKPYVVINNEIWAVYEYKENDRSTLSLEDKLKFLARYHNVVDAYTEVRTVKESQIKYKKMEFSFQFLKGLYHDLRKKGSDDPMEQLLLEQYPLIKTYYRNLKRDLPEELYDILPKALIQGDYNDSNILRCNGKPTGIIDSKSTFDARILDLALVIIEQDLTDITEDAMIQILCVFNEALDRKLIPQEINALREILLLFYFESTIGNAFWFYETRKEKGELREGEWPNIDFQKEGFEKIEKIYNLDWTTIKRDFMRHLSPLRWDASIVSNVVRSLSIARDMNTSVIKVIDLSLFIDEKTNFNAEKFITYLTELQNYKYNLQESVQFILVNTGNEKWQIDAKDKLTGLEGLVSIMKRSEVDAIRRSGQHVSSYLVERFESEKKDYQITVAYRKTNEAIFGKENRLITYLEVRDKTHDFDHVMLGLFYHQLPVNMVEMVVNQLKQEKIAMTGM